MSGLEIPGDWVEPLPKSWRHHKSHLHALCDDRAVLVHDVGDSVLQQSQVNVEHCCAGTKLQSKGAKESKSGVSAIDIAVVGIMRR